MKKFDNYTFQLQIIPHWCTLSFHLWIKLILCISTHLVGSYSYSSLHSKILNLVSLLSSELSRFEIISLKVFTITSVDLYLKRTNCCFHSYWHIKYRNRQELSTQLFIHLWSSFNTILKKCHKVQLIGFQRIDGFDFWNLQNHLSLVRKLLKHSVLTQNLGKWSMIQTILKKNRSR